MRRQRTCLQCCSCSLLIYLTHPHPSLLAGLLRIHYTHTIDGPSVLAPSQPTYSLDLTTAHMTCTARLHLSGSGQSLKHPDGSPQPRCNRVHVVGVLKPRVQCTARHHHVTDQHYNHARRTCSSRLLQTRHLLSFLVTSTNVDQSQQLLIKSAILL